MFGFLKNKLKEWVGKAKEKIEKQEPKEEPIQEKKAKKQKKDKKEKKKQKIIEQEPVLKPEEAGTSIAIESEIEEGVPQDIIDQELKEKSEKIKQEVPQTFNAGTERFEPDIEQIKQEIEETKGKKGFFARIKEKFTYKITQEEFEELFNDLEMLLLENNVALDAVEDIKKKLTERLIGREIKKEDLESQIKAELKNILNEILIEPDDILFAVKAKKAMNKPFVMLFFGINGTGKTTTIAKIANLLQKNKFSVVLAAADTFRAASIEQISMHADKLKIPLIKQDYGSDPSAVGFDAIKYAENHKIDVVLIDTAGRMHTKSNLLNEMEKICRVTKPDLKIFVAESIAGNDATEQAKSFNDLIQIDGAILTKADVDEKGGTIISISYATNKPIFYLGTGQEYSDIEPFNKEKFIEKLGL
jgi:fused signal recognition particle receptor